MQALDIQMQADIMQSKKDHHEQLAKALGEEDQLYAEEIKSFVSDLKSANSFNQDEIFQKINKTKEKIIQKENDLSNIKDIFDNKKNEIMQESKRNKEISTENKKSLEEDIKKEVLSLNNNEKENIREQLKRARELEHAYRIYGNEFEMIQRQIKVSYRQKLKDDKESLSKKIQYAKLLRNKQKASIRECLNNIEDAKDVLNMMKINYFYMQEGIEID